MEQLTMVNSPDATYAWALQFRSEDPIRHKQFESAYLAAMTRHSVQVHSYGVGNYSIIDFDEIDYIKIWKASTDIGNCMGLIILFA